MLLSVITINLNNKIGLAQTIKSVSEQTFKEFEYIVIDGGSTDGSLAVIEQSAGINYWVSETDNGIYHAMNKGIKQAQGKYLLFLNSGDTLHHTNSLSHLATTINDAAVYYTSAFCINNETGKGYIQHYPKQITVNYLLERSINHQNCVIKSSLFHKYHGYDESFKIASFRVFTLTLAKNHEKFVYLPHLIISNYDLNGISSDYIASENEWKQAVAQKHPELLAQLNYIHTKKKRLIYRAFAKLKRLYFNYKINHFNKVVGS